MGSIRHAQTGRLHMLPEWCVVGRAPTCDIHLTAPSVSAEHAVIRWAKPGWRVVDLGSRNGTWVDGRRLEPGVAAQIDRGATLCFSSGTDPWLLESADAPQAFVAGPNVEWPIGEGLALPGPDDPQVQIWPTGDHSWLVEDERGRQLAEDRATFHIDGARWRLYLPSEVAQTAAASRAIVTFEDSQLIIRHDLVEEYVTAELRPPAGEAIELGSRTHHTVLLELARVRLEDRVRGIDVAEEGWVHREELGTRTHLDESHLNILIFRLRQQLAEAGVLGAHDVVERRQRSGMLRVGTANVFIERMM